ncbi:membrane protein DedA, SNARE-associated domain [Lentzea fradiae]|uniref:Membrane protein DedA, SNARE-associated domain n=1 Tax=Lentzea fradiae TaxID=200378 RepID=A0A1G7P0A6_9PSEU|nr:DedA family protein [Lentzea fradiae]SDF79735.1 membrane protein DedA, SNARE-associated domain [Lentzea fradiae]
MLAQWLHTVPPLLVYVVVGLVVGIESVGVPVPGEIVLITAALMASHHDGVSPWVVGASATAGAVIGDSIGYALGKRFGPRIFGWAGEKFPRHFSPAKIDRARGVFHRFGAWAVFFGRFVALLRILSGPLAATMGLHYGKFLLANATGGLAWAGGTTAVVYLLGEAAEHYLAEFSWVALVVVLVAAAGFAVRSRLRRSSR